jgi:parallel beta-helix repeat protein
MFTVLTLCFLIISSVSTFFFTDQCTARGREIYVDNHFHYPRDGTADHPYQKIADALSVANDFDTIYVFGGTYNETLTINKRVNLSGGVDDEETIISYGAENRYTVDITADFVTLEHFTILDTNDHISYENGALIHVSSSNVMLQKNNLTQCKWWGIYLESSDDNTISGNLVNYTKGVRVSSSDNNVFSNNTFINSTDYDVYVSSSAKNILWGNHIATSVYGIYLKDCSETNITENTIFKNVRHGIFLFRDRSSIISKNTITDNNNDITVDSDDSIITKNTIIRGQVGITVQGSGCDISDNTIKNVISIGFSAVAGSKNNVIFRNHFLNNDENAKEQGSNQWYNGSQGNYWDDYKQVDRDRNGIGDTHYLISAGGRDRYPLGIFLRPPQKPSTPTPTDDKENVGLKVTLKVKVIDPDSDFLQNVSFYNAMNNKYLGSAPNVLNNTFASWTLTLSFNTTFAWYAIANDSQLENQSDIWFFTTKQRPPENKKPVANPGGPYIGKLSQLISFDGSRSGDPDGKIIFYRWNFGDGSSEILDTTPTHSYSDPGIYTITLTVVDDDGRSSMANTTATISGDILLNSPPVAVIVPLSSIEVNQLATFDASGSYDVDGSIVGYRWNFDNDEVYDTAWLETGLTTHTFSTAQTAVVTLEVKDDGNSTSTFSTSVTVAAAEKKTPGFEILFVFLALGSCLLVYRKQRR